jgi:hypothetical protein
MLNKGGNLNEQCPVDCEGKNASCNYGSLINHYAGFNANMDIFKFLLENGAEITTGTRSLAEFYDWKAECLKIIEYIDSISEQQQEQ